MLNWRESIEQPFANPKRRTRPVSLTVSKQARLAATRTAITSRFSGSLREKQRQLVESLRSIGLSTPILVRPLKEDGAFELVSGERRCRAAKDLEWESIQAVCEEMTDAEDAAHCVTENEVRSDANIMERAAGYKRLTEPPCNFNFEELAHRCGLSSATSVRRIVDLLDEPVCALFGEEIELGGRRFKMNEEMMDQYLSDFRSAHESFVRDVRKRYAGQRPTESSVDPASSLDPRALGAEGLATTVASALGMLNRWRLTKGAR